MTVSKTFRSLLARLRRTIDRTLRRVAVSSATLTISLPPFVRLEIKTEPKPLKARQRRAA